MTTIPRRQGLLGDCLLWTFLKITQLAPFWTAFSFFHVLIFIQNGWGQIFGAFFTNSSGHPSPGSDF
jgi:hypothetical protein